MNLYQINCTIQSISLNTMSVKTVAQAKEKFNSITVPFKYGSGDNIVQFKATAVLGFSPLIQRYVYYVVVGVSEENADSRQLILVQNYDTKTKTKHYFLRDIDEAIFQACKKEQVGRDAKLCTKPGCVFMHTHAASKSEFIVKEIKSLYECLNTKDGAFEITNDFNIKYNYEEIIHAFSRFKDRTIESHLIKYNDSTPIPEDKLKIKNEQPLQECPGPVIIPRPTSIMPRQSAWTNPIPGIGIKPPTVINLPKVTAEVENSITRLTEKIVDPEYVATVDDVKEHLKTLASIISFTTIVRHEKFSNLDSALTKLAETLKVVGTYNAPDKPYSELGRSDNIIMIIAYFDSFAKGTSPNDATKTINVALFIMDWIQYLLRIVNPPQSEDRLTGLRIEIVRNNFGDMRPASQ